MADLNLSLLKSALIAAGKSVLPSSYKVLATFGSIRTSDTRFVGRKTGDRGGEYIMIRDANGDQMIIGLQNGTPAGASMYHIEQREQLVDFGEVKAGTIYFKAIAVAEEEE